MSVLEVKTMASLKPARPPKHAFHRYLLQHPAAGRWVTRSRYLYLTRLGRRPLRRYDALDRLDDDDYLVKTACYNRGRMLECRDRRSFRLIKLVSTVSGVERAGQTLFVGPRNEADLLNLYAFGFAWKGIRGLDLFSYSPKIDVGDMHHLPYSKGRFDITFSAWALTYSPTPQVAVNELIRVTRPGGVICVGCTYCPRTPEMRERTEGVRPVQYCTIAGIEELKVFFKHAEHEVLWQEQAPTWGGGDCDNLSLVIRLGSARET